MREIRVRKCKNGDKGYRYRYCLKGTSKDLTQDQIKSFRKFTFLFSPSMTDEDKEIVLNKYRKKL